MPTLKTQQPRSHSLGLGVHIWSVQSAPRKVGPGERPVQGIWAGTPGILGTQTALERDTSSGWIPPLGMQILHPIKRGTLGVLLIRGLRAGPLLSKTKGPAEGDCLRVLAGQVPVN